MDYKIATKNHNKQKECGEENKLCDTFRRERADAECQKPNHQDDNGRY